MVHKVILLKKINKNKLMKINLKINEKINYNKNGLVMTNLRNHMKPFWGIVFRLI